MNISWTNPLWSSCLFLIYVVTSCLGLYLVKAAEYWKTPVFAVGFVLYGAGALMWMVILRLMPLSVAFPIAAGSLIIGTLLTGVLFLNEKVSIVHIAGSLLILTGIVLIAINRRG